MTQTSWPFQGVDTTETQYSRLLRNITPFARSGVIGNPSDNNLKVIGDSTGMNVKVKVANGVSQAIVRGHMYESTAEETLTIAASSTNPRIDSCVLTLNPTLNTIVLAIVQGTPAVTPAAPSLTQTDSGIFQFKLADIAVAANASTISAAAVTDMRQFVENIWTTATRPAPFQGLIGYNTSTSAFEFYSGTSWGNLLPSSYTASQISDPLNLNVGKINGSKFSVQSTAPSSPSTNDIWFW